MADETNAEKQLVGFDEAEEEVTVTVLHGYGRVAPTERHWVDNTLFVGGVARHVPASIAKAFKKVPRLGASIHILPESAAEADFAKASGIQPMATPKFAAMLNAIDLDKLADELGPTRTREIADHLIAKTEGKVVRDNTGKWRRNRTGAAAEE